MQRIFVTALSVISCVGADLDRYWEGINRPRGTSPNELELPVPIPGNVDGRLARRMNRFSLMTLSASKMIMEELPADRFDESRIGTVYTTGYGPLNSIITLSKQLESQGVDLVSPTVFTSTVYNSGLGHTCLSLKLKGVSTMLMGSNAIAYAADLLKADKADVILCGGVEEYCPELEESLKSKDYTTSDQEFLCRPLDGARSGTRVTEGSAMLMLAGEKALTECPDAILCEIFGYASLATPHNLARDPDQAGFDAMVQVMRLALEQARLSTDEIDGILMAAGGGRHVDKAEAKAIHEVFGARASSIPAASIKGAIGETMGASFAFNAVTAALAIQKGMLPLTAGCLEPDRTLELDVVHKEPRAGSYRFVMVNGYDVSGCVYSAIFGAVRG